ncbi:MAG: four helix bundle protein [Planctomycetota bacterium]
MGANTEEAQGSHSRAEFARRMNIARSEARGTLCWLRLAGEAGLVPKNRLAEMTLEAEELVKSLTTIVKKTRGHN